MKNDTKTTIEQKALELFSERGYDAVSVADIAAAVGIKAPSLYNHFKSKQEIFEAIVESTARQYEQDTDKMDIHVQSAESDFNEILSINGEALCKKVEQIFDYSLHDENICRFRKMLTIEQFRSEELGRLYTKRFVDRLVNYHAKIFVALAKAGVICDADPNSLALMYVSPVITLIGICDREPQKEAECRKKLYDHVLLFYNMVQKKND